MLLELLRSALVLENPLIEICSATSVAILGLVVDDDEVCILISDVLLVATGVLLGHDHAGWKATLAS